MAVSLSYLAGAGWQLFDNNGVPLSGGLLYTYAAGTTTPQVTYTSNSGSVANSNPIILDSAGRVSEEIWLTIGREYKFVLKDSTGVQIWSHDNITGIANFPLFFTSNYDTFADALSAAAGATLYINSAVTIPDNVTLPSTIQIQVLKPGFITIAVGKTLTISSAFSASYTRIFANSGTVQFTYPAEINAGWWDYLTDAGIAINNAINAIGGIPTAKSGATPQYRTGGVGGRIVLPPVVATAYTTVNLASFITQYLEIVGTSNSTIIDFNISSANPICFDCTGSNHITFKDFKIRGSSVNTPNVGFYYARDAISGSGLFLYMYNIITSGYFTNSCVYNYGSEENCYYNCYFQQSANNSACYSSNGDNGGAHGGIVSVYTTTSTAQESNSANHFFGCSFLQQGEEQFTDAIRFRQTYNYNFYGSFFASTGSAALQEITITNSACTEANGTYNVILTGGDPTTTATATYTVSSNVITTVTITNNGSGYRFQPTAATQSGTGTLTPFAYGPRSFIFIDTSAPIGCISININGWRMEVPNVTQYGVLVSGSASQMAYLTLTNGYLYPAIAGLYATDGSTISNLTWSTIVNIGPSKYGINIYNSQYCNIQEYSSVTIRGNSAGDVIYCDQAKTTIASNNGTALYYTDGSINSGYGLYHRNIAYVSNPGKTPDFVLSGLTTDGTWRTLDLHAAGILLPYGTRTVALSVDASATAAGKVVQFREGGQTSVVSVSTIATQVANVSNYADLQVHCSQTATIEYLASSATWNSINIVVRGWW